MDHRDHVDLLAPVVEPGGTWLDAGAGTGAFTLALADLLGDGGRIVAVDRDAGALHEASAAVRRRFPDVAIEAVVADFTGALDLPPLDGIVAANSLHFLSPGRQPEAIERLASHLRPGGAFVIVEYDADRGNPWVPHPFGAGRWPTIAAEAGLLGARPIGRVPSRFLGAIYSAVAYRPAG